MRVTGCLESKKVVFVAAHQSHTACITEDEDAYTWGNGKKGKLGHGDERSHFTPKLVEGLAGKKVKELACGGHHTLVRTEDGRVFSFGDGKRGQLGHGNFGDQWRPTIIEPLKGKFIAQVACGWEHSIALASDGRLYSWGNGDDGGLGHGSALNYCIPSIVEGLMGYKVVHIASNGYHSVALVEDSKRMSYAKKMKAMIDNETCSDVVFLLKDGERIHANKGLLIGQSEYFQAMFRSGMKESKENEVEVGDCSKGVFLLFLEYLYKGEVDIEIDNVIELYALSDRYQEDGLSSQCLEVIEGGLTNTNAIDLLAATDGAGLDALKDVCMDYVVANLKSIKKEGVDSLSRSLMVELLKSV
jgi:RCC1 and BTB domain-containing protein